MLMKIRPAVVVAIFAFITCLIQVRAQTPTELARGASGMSPREYYELSLEAARLFEARNYAAAAKAFERLATSYPYDGNNWYWLGRSLYENKQFKEAAGSFRRAYELGALVQAG